MKEILEKFDLTGELPGIWSCGGQETGGRTLETTSPIDSRKIGSIRCATGVETRETIATATEAFRTWRLVPAPERGEVVRQITESLRNHQDDLAELITLEVGKILPEARGEVREMIDMGDFAVGLSRMLYGKSMQSERPDHRMFEQWHPLGPVGVITAFNFPVAVWAWNALIALVCGDTVIWKPSSKAVLSAIAVMKTVRSVMQQNHLPDGILNLVIGDRETVGGPLIQDRRIPLISATGSVRMGRQVAQAVAGRFGKSILELGGNNAVIVTPSADRELALKAVLFGAVGTAGQRCTSTRRVILHQGLFDDFCSSLIAAYKQIEIGNPFRKGVHMGPLIDPQAVENMQAAIDLVKQQGGRVLYGGDTLSGKAFDSGTYVRPCIVEAAPDMSVVQEETFAPIVYLFRYETINEAITLQNSVPQGLSSGIFTGDVRESEMFLSQRGSDCGIANVNVGTSGAEIGGAFGGEKETGGGREAGSDAWKAYMRRQTSTVNWSGELPLAQGIKFDI